MNALHFLYRAVSFKSLEANEVGLDYDTFSQQINDRLYSGGTYFLGLAHKYVCCAALVTLAHMHSLRRAHAQATLPLLLHGHGALYCTFAGL